MKAFLAAFTNGLHKLCCDDRMEIDKFVLRITLNTWNITFVTNQVLILVLLFYSRHSCAFKNSEQPGLRSFFLSEDCLLLKGSLLGICMFEYLRLP